MGQPAGTGLHASTRLHPTLTLLISKPPVLRLLGMHALPLMLGALAILAIAYRFYSAFIAARVLALDESRQTPAHALNDGANYHPTHPVVLFGHHFAAITGAGPL